MQVYVAGSGRLGGNRLSLALDRIRRHGLEPARAHWDVSDFRDLGRLACEDMAMTAEAQRSALEAADFRARWRHLQAALDEADVLVLVEPAGRSAHMEAGYAVGRGKPVVVWLIGGNRPELSLQMAAALCATLDEVLDALRQVDAARAAPVVAAVQ